MANLEKNLLDVIEEELAVRGYVEVEPGRWSNPECTWVDKLIPAIVDCFEREGDNFV